MSGYTKGPWVVGTKTGHTPTSIFAGEDAVASVYGMPLHTKLENIDKYRFGNSLANARLIAAAPELLESLEMMLELYHHANPNAFTNGVTDSTGSIDEGDVIASDIAHSAKLAIKKAKGE